MVLQIPDVGPNVQQARRKWKAVPNSTARVGRPKQGVREKLHLRAGEVARRGGELARRGGELARRGGPLRGRGLARVLGCASARGACPDGCRAWGRGRPSWRCLRGRWLSSGATCRTISPRVRSRTPCVALRQRPRVPPEESRAQRLGARVRLSARRGLTKAARDAPLKCRSVIQAVAWCGGRATYRCAGVAW